MAAGATFCAWDIVRLGRSARQETFTQGSWQNAMEVWQDGKPLWIDRQKITGDQWQIDHDQLFKQLLENFFIDFIELFALALSEYLDLTQLTFLPQQYFTDILDGDRKAVDLLVQVPIKSNEITAAQPIHDRQFLASFNFVIRRLG